jgi:hypothetical protein
MWVFLFARCICKGGSTTVQRYDEKDYPDVILKRCDNIFIRQVSQLAHVFSGDFKPS